MKERSQNPEKHEQIEAESGGSKTNGLAVHWEITARDDSTQGGRAYGRKGIEGEIDCEQLETKGRSKGFKVGFNLEELQKMEDPDFLPKNIITGPFDFVP